MQKSRINGMNCLSNLKDVISERILDSIEKDVKQKSTIRAMFSNNDSKGPAVASDEKLLIDCKKLNPRARAVCLELIYGLLSTMRIDMLDLDAMLSQYYINYYGSPTDITSSKNPIALSVLKKILISPTDDVETKLRKLAQIIYQDLYGVGVLDELLYMSADSASGVKVEEIASFGPNCQWFAASGIPTKLDKINVPETLLSMIVTRLSENEPEFNLNKTTPSLSTDSSNGDRISITCPEYTRYYDFNIRRHYPGVITKEIMIESGSTTAEYEAFMDLVMNFYPSIILTGDQSAGKTTRLRMIAERYPANTVIGTIESSFELELSKINHLIVKQLRALSLGPEKALEDCLRFGLHVMCNGETRNGREVDTVLQVALRSSKGTLTTSHAPDAWACLRTYTQMLVKDKIYTNEKSALYAISQAIHLIIVPAVDNNGDDATGLRYIDAVYELPKLKESEMDNFEPRILFEADREDNFRLKQVNRLSDSTLKVFAKRSRNMKAIEKLRSGIYV